MSGREPSSPQPPSERPSTSLLVRCWLEPGEGESGAPILRGYVRNLKTGEQTFIGDADAVGQQILRQLTTAAARSSEVEHEREMGSSKGRAVR